MTATLLRVINQQRIVRSILLDKIDRSQASFETGITYAQQAKQKLYVPYTNPADSNVKGYVDLIPTDNVLLASGLANGVITKLVAKGYVTTTAFASSLTVAPTILTATDSAGSLTVTGTTFLSLAPDQTYVVVTNPTTGAVQSVPQAQFTSQNNTTIVIANAVFTIGTPTTTWKVYVMANSKKTSVLTM